jgi:hypothetical protein
MYAQQILQHSYTYVKYSPILLTLTQQKTAHQVCIKIWDEERATFSRNSFVILAGYAEFKHTTNRLFDGIRIERKTSRELSYFLKRSELSLLT